MIYSFQTLDTIKNSTLRKNFSKFVVSHIEPLEPTGSKDNAFITLIAATKPITVKVLTHIVHYKRKTFLDKVKSAKLLALEIRLYRDGVEDDYISPRFILLKTNKTDIFELLELVFGKGVIKQKFLIEHQTNYVIDNLQNHHILGAKVLIKRLAVRPTCPERMRDILEETLNYQPVNS